MFEKLARGIGDAKRRKFGTVMREFYNKKLKHGSTGKVVDDVQVAKAIAASEAGVSRKDKRRK